MRRRDPTRFFTRGSVDVLVEDPVARQVELRVTAPACVVHAAMPQLLAAGLLDGYEVASPISAWVPTVADEGFLPSPDGADPARMNAEARAVAKATLDFFGKVSGRMRFPGDLVPLLPMGVYVTFRLRCAADDLARALPAMVLAAGVAELRYALAAALAVAYSRWGEPPAALPSA